MYICMYPHFFFKTVEVCTHARCMQSCVGDERLATVRRLKVEGGSCAVGGLNGQRVLAPLPTPP